MKIILKKLPTLVVLLLAATAVRADWYELDRTYKNETTYIDLSRIRREGDKAYYWTLSNYTLARDIGGKMALSEVNQSVVDCVRQVQSASYFVWYSGPNASGDGVNFMLVQEELRQYFPIIPGSMADRAAKIVCEAK